MENTGQKKEDFFKAIGGEESIREVTEIESFCVNCEQNVIM